MATTLFFRRAATGGVADAHLGTNNPKLDTTTSGWRPAALATTRGAGVTPYSSTPVAGPTLGVEIGPLSLAFPIEWLSPPLSADVTISGTITANIWAAETDMNGNVAINVQIDRVSRVDGTITSVVKSTRITEVAVTTRAVNNFTTGMTSGAYTGVAFARGDRIRIRIFGDDAGTMGAAGSFNAGVDGTTGAADGDSFVTFTETFAFESAPAGSVLYLTDVASDVNPGAAIEKEAWTSRGSGSTSSVTNTSAGWVAPIQTTATAGGTAIEWYTRGLTAFTLGGNCVFNVRASEAAATGVSIRAEVAVTANDGSSATVLGSICIDLSNPFSTGGNLSTTEAAYTVNVGVDDTSVTNGQRLRFRIYADDTADIAMTAAKTATVTYSGTSAAAAGDTYVTLPQSVTEFVTSIPETKAPDVFLQAVKTGSLW